MHACCRESVLSISLTRTKDKKRREEKLPRRTNPKCADSTLAMRNEHDEHKGGFVYENNAHLRGRQANFNSNYNSDETKPFPRQFSKQKRRKCLRSLGSRPSDESKKSISVYSFEAGQASDGGRQSDSSKYSLSESSLRSADRHLSDSSNRSRRTRSWSCLERGRGRSSGDQESSVTTGTEETYESDEKNGARRRKNMTLRCSRKSSTTTDSEFSRRRRAAFVARERYWRNNSFNLSSSSIRSNGSTTSVIVVSSRSNSEPTDANSRLKVNLGKSRDDGEQQNKSSEYIISKCKPLIDSKKIAVSVRREDVTSARERIAGHVRPVIAHECSGWMRREGKKSSSSQCQSTDSTNDRSSSMKSTRKESYLEISREKGLPNNCYAGSFNKRLKQKHGGYGERDENCIRKGIKTSVKEKKGSEMSVKLAHVATNTFKTKKKYSLTKQTNQKHNSSIESSCNALKGSVPCPWRRRDRKCFVDQLRMRCAWQAWKTGHTQTSEKMGRSSLGEPKRINERAAPTQSGVSSVEGQGKSSSSDWPASCPEKESRMSILKRGQNIERPGKANYGGRQFERSYFTGNGEMTSKQYAAMRRSTSTDSEWLAVNIQPGKKYGSDLLEREILRKKFTTRNKLEGAQQESNEMTLRSVREDGGVTVRQLVDSDQSRRGASSKVFCDTPRRQRERGAVRSRGGWANGNESQSDGLMREANRQQGRCHSYLLRKDMGENDKGQRNVNLRDIVLVRRPAMVRPCKHAVKECESISSRNAVCKGELGLSNEKERLLLRNNQSFLVKKQFCKFRTHLPAYVKCPDSGKKSNTKCIGLECSRRDFSFDNAFRKVAKCPHSLKTKDIMPEKSNFVDKRGQIRVEARFPQNYRTTGPRTLEAERKAEMKLAAARPQDLPFIRRIPCKFGRDAENMEQKQSWNDSTERNQTGPVYFRKEVGRGWEHSHGSQTSSSARDTGRPLKVDLVRRKGILKKDHSSDSHEDKTITRAKRVQRRNTCADECKRKCAHTVSKRSLDRVTEKIEHRESFRPKTELKSVSQTNRSGNQMVKENEDETCHSRRELHRSRWSNEPCKNEQLFEPGARPKSGNTCEGKSWTNAPKQYETDDKRQLEEIGPETGMPDTPMPRLRKSVLRKYGVGPNGEFVPKNYPGASDLRETGGARNRGVPFSGIPSQLPPQVRQQRQGSSTAEEGLEWTKKHEFIDDDKTGESSTSSINEDNVKMREYKRISKNTPNNGDIRGDSHSTLPHQPSSRYSGSMDVSSKNGTQRNQTEELEPRKHIADREPAAHFTRKYGVDKVSRKPLGKTHGESNHGYENRMKNYDINTQSRPLSSSASKVSSKEKEISKSVDRKPVTPGSVVPERVPSTLRPSPDKTSRKEPGERVADSNSKVIEIKGSEPTDSQSGESSKVLPSVKDNWLNSTSTDDLHETPSERYVRKYGVDRVSRKPRGNIWQDAKLKRPYHSKTQNHHDQKFRPEKFAESTETGTSSETSQESKTSVKDTSSPEGKVSVHKNKNYRQHSGTVQSREAPEKRIAENVRENKHEHVSTVSKNLHRKNVSELSDSSQSEISRTSQSSSGVILVEEKRYVRKFGFDKVSRKPLGKIRGGVQNTKAHSLEKLHQDKKTTSTSISSSSSVQNRANNEAKSSADRGFQVPKSHSRGPVSTSKQVRHGTEKKHSKKEGVVKKHQETKEKNNKIKATSEEKKRSSESTSEISLMSGSSTDLSRKTIRRFGVDRVSRKPLGKIRGGIDGRKNLVVKKDHVYKSSSTKTASGTENDSHPEVSKDTKIHKSKQPMSDNRNNVNANRKKGNEVVRKTETFPEDKDKRQSKHRPQTKLDKGKQKGKTGSDRKASTSKSLSSTSVPTESSSGFKISTETSSSMIFNRVVRRYGFDKVSRKPLGKIRENPKQGKQHQAKKPQHDLGKSSSSKSSVSSKTSRSIRKTEVSITHEKASATTASNVESASGSSQRSGKVSSRNEPQGKKLDKIPKSRVKDEPRDPKLKKERKSVKSVSSIEIIPSSKSSAEDSSTDVSKHMIRRYGFDRVSRKPLGKIRGGMDQNKKPFSKAHDNDVPKSSRTRLTVSQGKVRPSKKREGTASQESMSGSSESTVSSENTFSSRDNINKERREKTREMTSTTTSSIPKSLNDPTEPKKHERESKLLETHKAKSSVADRDKQSEYDEAKMPVIRKYGFDKLSRKPLGKIQGGLEKQRASEGNKGWHEGKGPHNTEEKGEQRSFKKTSSYVRTSKENSLGKTSTSEEETHQVVGGRKMEDISSSETVRSKNKEWRKNQEGRENRTFENRKDGTISSEQKKDLGDQEVHRPSFSRKFVQDRVLRKPKETTRGGLVSVKSRAVESSEEIIVHPKSPERSREGKQEQARTPGQKEMKSLSSDSLYNEERQPLVTKYGMGESSRKPLRDTRTDKRNENMHEASLDTSKRSAGTRVGVNPEPPKRDGAEKRNYDREKAACSNEKDHGETWTQPTKRIFYPRTIPQTDVHEVEDPKLQTQAKTLKNYDKVQTRSSNKKPETQMKQRKLTREGKNDRRVECLTRDLAQSDGKPATKDDQKDKRGISVRSNKSRGDKARQVVIPLNPLERKTEKQTGQGSPVDKNREKKRLETVNLDKKSNVSATPKKREGHFSKSQPNQSDKMSLPSKQKGQNAQLNTTPVTQGSPAGEGDKPGRVEYKKDPLMLTEKVKENDAMGQDGMKDTRHGVTFSNQEPEQHGRTVRKEPVSLESKVEPPKISLKNPSRKLLSQVHKDVKEGMRQKEFEKKMQLSESSHGEKSSAIDGKHFTQEGKKEVEEPRRKTKIPTFNDVQRDPNGLNHSGSACLESKREITKHKVGDDEKNESDRGLGGQNTSAVHRWPCDNHASEADERGTDKEPKKKDMKVTFSKGPCEENMDKESKIQQNGRSIAVAEKTPCKERLSNDTSKMLDLGTGDDVLTESGPTEWRNREHSKSGKVKKVRICEGDERQGLERKYTETNNREKKRTCPIRESSTFENEQVERKKERPDAHDNGRISEARGKKNLHNKFTHSKDNEIEGEHPCIYFRNLPRETLMDVRRDVRETIKRKRHGSKSTPKLRKPFRLVLNSGRQSRGRVESARFRVVTTPEQHNVTRLRSCKDKRGNQLFDRDTNARLNDFRGAQKEKRFVFAPNANVQESRSLSRTVAARSVTLPPRACPRYPTRKFFMEMRRELKEALMKKNHEPRSVVWVPSGGMLIRPCQSNSSCNRKTQHWPTGLETQEELRRPPILGKGSYNLPTDFRNPRLNVKMVPCPKKNANLIEISHKEQIRSPCSCESELIASFSKESKPRFGEHVVFQLGLEPSGSPGALLLGSRKTNQPVSPVCLIPNVARTPAIQSLADLSRTSTSKRVLTSPTNTKCRRSGTPRKVLPF